MLFDIFGFRVGQFNTGVAMAPDLNALKLGAGGLLCLEEKSGTALGWKEPVSSFLVG